MALCWGRWEIVSSGAAGHGIILNHRQLAHSCPADAVCRDWTMGCFEIEGGAANCPEPVVRFPLKE